jgi:hypothetical protein
MNNPPAFPSTHHNGWGEPEKGMTLRDYFAAKALQGMLAESGGGALHNTNLSEFAYLIADAMMKAREA